MRSTVLGTMLAATLLASFEASGAVECRGSVNIVDYTAETGGDRALSGPRYQPPACTVDLDAGTRTIAMRWSQAATGVARVDVIANDGSGEFALVCSVDAGIAAACGASGDYESVPQSTLTSFDVTVTLPTTARAAFSVGAPVYGACEAGTGCVLLWVAAGDFTATFA